MSKEELESQFSLLGVDVSDKVLDECVKICNRHNCMEEELVEVWMAFSVSKLFGADPTLETIREMERKEYTKKETIIEKKIQKNKSSLKTSSKDSSYQLKVYNGDELHNSTSNGELNVYNAYASSPRLMTPSQRNDSYNEGSPDLNISGKSPGRMFSPAGFSPAIATPSRRYTSRTNAGTAVLSHGDVNTCTWRPAEESDFTPRIALLPSKNILSANTPYMYARFADEDDLHNEHIELFAKQIIQKYSLGDYQSNVEPCQESFVTYGRVGCVGEEAIGISSTTLEGTDELSYGQAVPLYLTALDKCALFPGQIVVVKGTNPTGKLLLADKIYSEAKLPLPIALPKFSDSDGPLQIVVASGPYTPTDTMNYQPLEDLISYVVKEQPHVLILIGPFIDEEHPHVTGGLLAETYVEYFNKIIDNISEQLKGLRTQVVIVASSRDIHHMPLYPTPPYSLAKCPPNFMLVSDPATLDISGVIIGVSATDVIKHMVGKEVEHQWHEVPNKLHRIAQYVLSQRCFYPLYPPAEEVNIDTELFYKHAYLDVTPHILLLPSDLRYFARVIDGCLAVNPEHLAKGLVGGMFGRIEIKPPTETITPEEFVAQNIHCQMVRI